VVSEHYSASRSKPKENTRSADNTSELQGYHTARNALDNIMQKLYLVIEHKCCDLTATSYDDIFDAYRLALEFYHHKSE
jgi:hypothetical protein